MFAGGEDLAGAIEQVAVLGARLLLQAAIGAEVTAYLGRDRYERAASCEDARAGMRNGYCPTTVIIWSPPTKYGFELGVCVVEGVFDAAVRPASAEINRGERFTNSHACVIQQGKQQSVPQSLATVQYGLHLDRCEHQGQLLRCLQRDHSPRFRFALADVMQERPPAATRTTDLPRRQQLAHLDAVSTGVGIARADRRKLAIHSGFRAVMRHRRQHSDPSIAGLQRQPQLSDELAHILKPHRPPIQPTRRGR